MHRLQYNLFAISLKNYDVDVVTANIAALFKIQLSAFGYMNYLVKRDRRFIVDILINGLHRLEYRGYDSSGIAFDGDEIEGNNADPSSKPKRSCIVVRQKGKVEELERAVKGKFKFY